MLGDRNGDWWPEWSTTATDSINVGFPDYFLVLQPCLLLRNVGRACITVPAERAYNDRMVQERITKFKDLMEDTGPVLRWEIDAVSNLTGRMKGESFPHAGFTGEDTSRTSRTPCLITSELQQM